MNLNNLCAFVFQMLAVSSQLCAQEYSIEFEYNGKRVGVIELTINSEEAIAKVAGGTERFDLKNQRWQDEDSGQWVSLAQCEAWAKQSKEISNNSTASIPEKGRPFIAWSLSPTFEVKETNSTLKLASGQVDYEIVVTKSDGDLTSFFKYARLNAYKKAMTERKLAPFAELKVLEELERRKVLPKSMEVRIPGLEGAPAFKTIFNEKPN